MHEVTGDTLPKRQGVTRCHPVTLVEENRGVGTVVDRPVWGQLSGAGYLPAFAGVNPLSACQDSVRAILYSRAVFVRCS